MIRYRVLPEAWKDVERASDFILERDPDAVGVVYRFYEAVGVTGEAIADLPLGYTAHPHYRKETEGLRRRLLTGFKRYTVYYRVADDGVPELVRVLHGARDHGALLEDKGDG